MAEQNWLEQVRAALRIASEMLCNHESGHMTAFQGARDRAYAALTALPSAEEWQRTQREMAALRSLYSVIETTGTWKARGENGVDGSAWLLTLEERQYVDCALEAVEAAQKGGGQ